MKDLLKNNTTAILIVVFVIAVLLSVYFYGKKSAQSPDFFNIKKDDVKNDIAKGYDPSYDAAEIHKAISNTWAMIGANDPVVNAIILNKNDTELRLIMNAYLASFNENLIEALEDEWATDFSQAISRLRQAI